MPSGPHFRPFFVLLFCNFACRLASSPDDWFATDRAAAAAAFFARLEVRGPGELDTIFDGVAGLEVFGVGMGVTSVDVLLLVGGRKCAGHH